MSKAKDYNKKKGKNKLNKNNKIAKNIYNNNCLSWSTPASVLNESVQHHSIMTRQNLAPEGHAGTGNTLITLHDPPLSVLSRPAGVGDLDPVSSCSLLRSPSLPSSCLLNVTSSSWTLKHTDLTTLNPKPWSTNKVNRLKSQ